MSKQIRTYEELLEEKKRLQTLIAAQKELIRYDLKDLGSEMKPVSVAFRFLKNITTRRKNGVLDYGTNLMVDVFLKKVLLSRTSWFTKLLVPFFVKNYASHLMADSKTSVWERITSWLGRNGKHPRSESSTGPNKKM